MVKERYISIDIETTGLDPERCQILEIGAVIEDWKKPILQLPTFQCFVQHEEYRGQPRALLMNSRILKILTNPEYLTPLDTAHHQEYHIFQSHMVYDHFAKWLVANDFSDGKITVAGKNFGSFDLQFLKHLPNFQLIASRFRHRFIDPAMLYWEPDDIVPPNTKECLIRAGMPVEITHEAVGDAQQVIKLIRHHVNLREKWLMR